MATSTEIRPTSSLDRPIPRSADPYYGDERMRHTIAAGQEIPFYREVLPLDTLVGMKRDQGLTVTGILPAFNEGTNDGTRKAPVEETIENLMGLHDAGLVDRFEVIFNGHDDTPEVVARAIEKYGNEALGFIYAPNVLGLYGHTTSLGKGGNLALATMFHPGSHDILPFIDTDCGMLPGQLQAIVSPLIEDPNTMLSLPMFERRTKAGNPDAKQHMQGGRITSFQLKPNFEMFFPHLNGLSQPIAGLYAGRGSALAEIDFPTDYRVETALIIESSMRHGADALAQVWCGVKEQDGHGTARLEEMAAQINNELFWQAHKWLGYPLPPNFDRAQRRVVNHTVAQNGHTELGIVTKTLQFRNIDPALTQPPPMERVGQVAQSMTRLFGVA